ncbi:insulinase family protein [Synechococcales cyanobacterium C]|uniref:Insulinase family protein n=2 Tax=Petrachloros TaxID=2918834 RepID=A0A8K1ZVP3_9CYAN|nr:insulinase family protein [Petrachloros mirabilis ULC683]
MPVRAMTSQRWILANGLTVIVTENPVANIIAARLFVRGGSLTETQTTAGLAHLLAATLTQGSAAHLPWVMADQIERAGAGLSVQAAPDYWVLSLKTVASEFETILALAAQVLRSPTFLENQVVRSQQLLIQDIQTRQEQPFMVAMQNLRQALYPNHPYAHATPNNAACLEQITTADLQQAHDTYFRPDQVVISIAGRVNPTTILDWVEQYFGDWSRPSPQPTLPNFALAPASNSPQTTLLSSNQVTLMLGHLAAAVHEPDYVPLKILHTYLSNGFSSRLSTELREKRGLAYEISGFYPTRLDPSHWVVHLATAPHQAKLALSLLEAEIAQLWQQPLSTEVSDRAKRKLLGQYALGKQTNVQLAHLAGWYECLGLGLAYDAAFQAQVMATTPTELYQTAQRWLQCPIRSLVGTESALASLG